jgi:hypothetical protein
MGSVNRSDVCLGAKSSAGAGQRRNKAGNGEATDDTNYGNALAGAAE